MAGYWLISVLRAAKVRNESKWMPVAAMGFSVVRFIVFSFPIIASEVTRYLILSIKKTCSLPLATIEEFMFECRLNL